MSSLNLGVIGNCQINALLDERARIISVTAAGRALRNKARDIPQQLACNIGLPAARARELRQLCTELLGALQD